MMMRFLALVCAGVLATGPAVAQDRDTIGVGRIFTNDYFGDNDDRWRTGSYAFSIIRGTEWQGVRPDRPGAMLEYRLRSEIIAPSRLNGVGSDDRAYAGALSAGVHTHYTLRGTDISAGIDMVVLGPQTGLLSLQDSFHDLVSAPNVSNAVEANQIGNSVNPTALVEAARPISLSETVTLRPFIEAQYGVEDIVRIGADVIVGPVGQQDLWLRDVSTGQLYRGVEGDANGLGYVFGLDYAQVGDSAYFPASFGTVAEDTRLRARAGVHWQFGEDTSLFYGLTYLSEEYVGQPEGQFLGSLKLSFNF